MHSDNILFVVHGSSQCGVYEFGENVFAAIRSSTRYNFVRAECSSLADLKRHVSQSRPRAIIYNYMPSTMPWVAEVVALGKVLKNNVATIPVPQIGIIHSILQDVADEALPGKLFRRGHPELANRLFDFYIAPDPTLLLNNSNVFKHGRPVPAYTNKFPAPERTTIGTFGFAKTGYDDLIELVQSEFADAVIRMHIPFATFGDTDGSRASAIAEKCRALVRKPGIELSISHEYLDRSGLLDFLAQNTINVFLRDKSGRGISSVLDNALAVDRPIAISDSPMFKHMLDLEPSIVIGRRSLKAIIADGTRPISGCRKAWTPENLCWEYERILDTIFSRPPRSAPSETIARAKHSLWVLRRLGLRGFKDFGSDIVQNSWIDKSSHYDKERRANPTEGTAYSPVPLVGTGQLNRVLDDDARRLYAPAVEWMRALAPKTFARKHSDANVQQAFVFDTVCRHLAEYKSPRLLCVGSFEDTACVAIRNMGIPVEEIDPLLNYTLQQFFTKPDTSKHAYDIIFSTSVIEHDPDDQSFMTCVSELLAPNGILVMTCDYKDGWKPGDTKPGVCERLYTKNDLERRLPGYLKHCHVLGEPPDWTSSSTDVFAQANHYSFASFCVRKSAAV